MATRGGRELPVAWILADLSHARRVHLLGAADRAGLATGELSINRNAAGTQALIKVLTTDFAARLPDGVRPAVLRTFTEADHSEARALVSSVDWTGPQEEES